MRCSMKSYKIAVVLLCTFFLLGAEAQCPTCSSQLSDLFRAELLNMTLKTNMTFSDQFTLPALDQVFRDTVDYMENAVKGMVTNGKLNIRGKTGRPGYPGIVGYIGATGLTGMIGATGDTGPRGTWGWPGVTGNTGFTGATGQMGLKGATGMTGAPGQKKRLTRRKRQTSTSTLRTKMNPIVAECSDLRTYANGFASAVDQLYSMKMVKIYQAIENVIYLQREVEYLYLDVKFFYNLAANKLSFDTKYQGATGLSGSPGMNGLTGATGPPGSKGATGPVGYSGATGLLGYQGEIGGTGFTGITGFTGANGANGYSP